jgi:adenosine deaminase
MTNTAFIPPAPDQAVYHLPKVNLHTHLEGSVRPSTFVHLASRMNLNLPFPIDQVTSNLQVDGSEKSLVDYLNKISVNYPVLKDYDSLKQVAFEAAEDAYLDGVVYFELRAGPLTHVSEKLPVEKCIEAMLEGLKDAEQKHGIIARLIVAALRNHDPAQNKVLAEAAVKYQDQGVVGYDLAGDEAGFPADLHMDAFNVIRGSALGLTVHAGEAGGFENVLNAIQEIGATRIGHGVHVIESPAAMEVVQDRQVLLEICPTSNVHTGAVANLESHPVKKIFDFGIRISIGDDDPVTSRTHVSNELMLLMNRFHFTEQELIQIQLFSIAHSFLRDPKLKEKLTHKIASFKIPGSTDQ